MADEQPRFDHRYPVAMLRVVRGFFDGSTTLRQCIDQLTAFEAQLQDMDPLWREDVRAHVESLREAFDSCVERQEPLSVEEYLRVKATVGELHDRIAGVTHWMPDEREAIKLIIQARRADLADVFNGKFPDDLSETEAAAIKQALNEEAAESAYDTDKPDDWGELLTGMADRVRARLGD